MKPPRPAHLLLDLDNTLYPASDGMDAGIRRRMLAFVADFLGVSLEEGTRLRAEGLPGHSTTLEWLRAKHGLTDEAAYFAAIHPEEEINELKEDPRLRPYLLSLGLPLTLLTNAPIEHARRLLSFYNIEDVFLGIFDITYHLGQGKPHASAFLNTLAAVGKTVEETLFVDDLPKYARGYKALGGRAVLVDPDGAYEALAREEGFDRIRSIYGLADLLAHY